MSVLLKEDHETVMQCRAMASRGECPPLLITYDSCEGYTVEAGGPIKALTFLAEYTGDVDYIKNRERDDYDSLMTLLLANDPSISFVICFDKRSNIARFVNGINNHTPEGKKKQNLKSVRYDVNCECSVFLVANRDIAKRERLYYDSNGYDYTSMSIQLIISFEALHEDVNCECSFFLSQTVTLSKERGFTMTTMDTSMSIQPIISFEALHEGLCCCAVAHLTLHSGHPRKCRFLLIIVG